MFVITLARKKGLRRTMRPMVRRTNISHTLEGMVKYQNNGTHVFCSVVSFGFPKNLPDYRITIFTFLVFLPALMATTYTPADRLTGILLKPIGVLPVATVLPAASKILIIPSLTVILLMTRVLLSVR